MTVYWKAVAVADRRRADRAAGNLHVLLAQRLDDVAGRHAVGRQLLRVEPDAQRIFALAEDDDVADAVEPQQHVADARAGIVRDIELVVGVVGRQHVHDHHQVGRALGRGDAEPAHFFRQARLGDRHAVLDQHLRRVEVGAEPEGDGQRHRAVARRIGRHVEHVLDAVDLLLERRGHGRGDGFGIGARIGGAHDDGRRGDLRILRGRQAACRRCTPTISSTIDRTDAKIGRSTKKCAKFIAAVLRRFGFRRQGDQFRLDLDARPHAHQAVDDDGLVAGQAFADDAIAVDARAGAHRLGRDQFRPRRPQRRCGGPGRRRSPRRERGCRDAAASRAR